MAISQPARVANKIDTKTNWTTRNPLLLQGEVAVEGDTGFVKIGDGTNNYNDLNYVYGVPVFRWVGTTLELLQSDGTYLGSNLIGKMPDSEWDGTKIRFEIAEGVYGEYRELMPSHEWETTLTKKEIRLQNPDGTFGEFIDLSSYNYFFNDNVIGSKSEWGWTNIPQGHLALDGQTIQKVDYEEFFEFLIAEGEITTETEYTLSTEVGKIIKVDSSKHTLAEASDEIIKKGLFNAQGEAPVYACRAWVNFNGMGVVAIRESGNVSSITDNGVGRYAVNFITSQTNTNYAVSQSIDTDQDAVSQFIGSAIPRASFIQESLKSTSGFQFFTGATDGTKLDFRGINLAIFGN